MRKLNVNDYGVSVIEMQDAKEVNGGDLIAAITVIGALIYVYNNWDDFAAGVSEGYEEVRNKRAKN